MLIKVFYRSGRLDAFDTVSFCTAEPYRRHGDNLLTEFQLLTDGDTLAAEGLMLEVFWYDPRIKEDTTRSGRHNLPHASRQAGNRIRLASKNELSDVVLVTVDGELLLWRQGEHLINGVMFKNQEILCYSNDAIASINRRALALYEYIRNANPSLNEDEAAALLGYTKDAIDDISFAEGANADFVDGFMSELNDSILEADNALSEENGEEEASENWDFT